MSSPSRATPAEAKEWNWRAAALDLNLPATDGIASLGPPQALDFGLPAFEPLDALTLAADFARLGVVSVPIRAPKIQTRGFVFPAEPARTERTGASALAPPPPIAPAQATPPPAPPTNERVFTRIKPPGDVIKLEDRLHYVLQPPLETIVSRQALHFPFHPFSYQFEGVAFLYPRYAA
ncbi:MAG TPA: hypothetical protein VHB99_08110, partial [Pirellulales bacterium]|nr:hypothetical protein [Pirellulales bacterium]